MCIVQYGSISDGASILVRTSSDIVPLMRSSSGSTVIAHSDGDIK